MYRIQELSKIVQPAHTKSSVIDHFTRCKQHSSRSTSCFSL